MARPAKAPPPSLFAASPAEAARARAYREHPQLVTLAEKLINLHYWEPARDLMTNPDAQQLCRLMEYYTGASREGAA